jgi:aspartate racemase
MHQAGADFVVAACNSVHVVHKEIADAISIPWISIMDATAERIRQAGFTRIGLLGTIFTMTKGFYTSALAAHGIETLLPEPDAQRRISRIIYDELITETVKEDSRRFAIECILRLIYQGAQGIILGCTELPFLIQQRHSSVPVFDTTEILAQKALAIALE